MSRRKATVASLNTIDSVAPVRKMPRVAFKMEVPRIPDRSGMALTCGQGDMGQLGLGEDTTERKKPALLDAIKNVVAICAGGMHNLCLTKQGEIFSFGCNDEGALGRDSSEEGSEFIPNKVDLPGKCVKISAGDSHSACLLEDGRVFAWGSFRDSHGNMGLTLEGNKRTAVDILPDITCCDISSGADHLVILTCHGKVYTVGCGEQGQLGRVSLRSASGESRRGKTELLKPGMVTIKGNKLIESIWATSYGTFMQEKVTSAIWACGLNNYHQLIYPKDISVVTKPININCENVKKISGGQHHTLVLKNDSKCYVIGRKDYGRLGLGEVNDDVKMLQRITSLDDKKIVDISCGEAQSFALTDNGHLYAWGMGTNMQLGTGFEEDALEPTLIVSKQTQDRRIIQASGGGQHSIFLVANDNIGNTNSTQLEKMEIVIPIKESAKSKVNDEEKITPTVMEVIKSNGIATPVAEDEGIEEAAKEDAKDTRVPPSRKRGRKKK